MVQASVEQQVAQSAVAPAMALSATRIAYLLSRYPAVSHTFFLHEVLGLRARGVHIETASINPPDRPFAGLPPDEQAESQRTLYIKRGSKTHLAGQVLQTAARNPQACLRGLGAIVRIRGLTLRKRLQWLFYLAEALLVGRWMRSRRLEHLHVHFGGPVASVGMLTAAAWGIPWSLTIHGPEELLDTGAYQLREKLTAAAFICCISDFCRSQVCQLLPPAQWDKCQVLRLGVDPLLLTPASRREDLAAERPPKNSSPARALELVCTGRLVAAKGHLVLLEALRLLRAEGLLLHTTLIGAGPELAHLQAFVALHDMAGIVTFTSALSHAQTLAQLRHADLFVLASFAEGIPVALMEAMALGIPCVSTTIAGIPELIRTGIDGLLVPPANAPALAEALERLALDPQLRQTFAASARQRILTHFNLPHNQELLANAFANRLHPPSV